MKIHSTLLAVGSFALLASVPLLEARQTPPKPEQTPPVQNPPPLPLPVRITGKTLVAAGELKWTEMPEIEGAQQAVLWGDPEKGAHRIMYMWPAGAKTPEHTHTYGDRGVVVSGTLTITIEGGTAKRLPAGSFFSLAGGTKHTTTNDASEPCMFFVEREGAFDVIPAK